MCKVSKILDRYQVILDSRLPIYFKEVVEINDENIIESILEFSKVYYTRYVYNNKVQCTRCANRSIGDIYRIAKYYIPSITLVDIFNMILTNNFVALFCSTVNKTVIDPVMRLSTIRTGDLLKNIIGPGNNIENNLKISLNDFNIYYAKLQNKSEK